MVVVAVLVIFAACAADVAVGLGWIPVGADVFYAVFGYFRGLLKRYVVDQRPEVVAAFVLAACAIHSVLLSFFPIKWMHWLRSDGLMRFALSVGWAEKIDKVNHRIRQHPALALILKLVELVSTLALLPLMVGSRLVLDPQNSRLAVACLFAPVATAVVCWAIIDFVRPERWIPEGFQDSPGSGRDKEKIVWVSAGVLAIVGGGYEVTRRWVAPGLARWFVGRTHPLAFQWGLGAAVGAALVLAGLHLDGNLLAPPVCDLQNGQSVCNNGEAPGSPLIPSQAPETQQSATEDALMQQSLKSQQSLGNAPLQPLLQLQPRTVHVGAIFVACAAVAAVHIALPVFNRREFAVIRAAVAEREP